MARKALIAVLVFTTSINAKPFKSLKREERFQAIIK